MLFNPPVSFGENVLRLQVEQVADGDAPVLIFVEATVLFVGTRDSHFPESEFAQLVERDESGRKAVVHVVGVVGHIVGDIGDLRFQILERPDGMAVEFGIRIGGFVLEQSGAHFPGEVEAGKAGILVFEHFNRAQALEVVVEPAVFFHQIVEYILAAMAERAVADVVREADGFG